MISMIALIPCLRRSSSFVTKQYSCDIGRTDEGSYIYQISAELEYIMIPIHLDEITPVFFTCPISQYHKRARSCTVVVGDIEWLVPESLKLEF